jgi:hypothetical protein
MAVCSAMVRTGYAPKTRFFSLHDIARFQIPAEGSRADSRRRFDAQGAHSPMMARLLSG